MTGPWAGSRRSGFSSARRRSDLAAGARPLSVQWSQSVVYGAHILPGAGQGAAAEERQWAVLALADRESQVGQGVSRTWRSSEWSSRARRSFGRLRGNNRRRRDLRPEPGRPCCEPRRGSESCQYFLTPPESAREQPTLAACTLTPFLSNSAAGRHRSRDGNA